MPSHPFWLLPAAGSGQLILTPCPGTKQCTLSDSLTQLKQAGAMAVVTMMTRTELQANQVADIEEQCKALDLSWFHLPIEDDNAPNGYFSVKWSEISAQLHQLLDQDLTLVLHCKGGSGRTGLVAAQLLLERGVELTSAKADIIALRPKAFSPQVHQEYIQDFAANLK